MKIEIDTGQIGATLGGWLHAAVVWCVTFVRRTVLYVGACASIAVLVLMLVGHSSPAPLPPHPPTPTDPLTKSFQAAYDADPDQAKAAHVKQLASLWTAAAQQVTDTNGPAKNSADFIAAAHATADSLVGAGGLPKVRRAVADHLNSVLGTTVLDLTPDNRAKLSTEFAKVAAALGGVK